jgi:hypothetical protein
MVPCVPGGPGIIAQGSATVLIGKLPAARMNDATAHASCVAPIPGPKGQIMPPCCPTVKIGGPTFTAPILAEVEALAASPAGVFDEESLSPSNPTDATKADSTKIGTDAERRAILLKQLACLPFSLIWPMAPLTKREQFIQDTSNIRLSNKYGDKKGDVEKDLEKIYNTPGGKKLLKDLNDTGKQTLIGPPKGFNDNPPKTGGNTTKYDDPVNDAVNGKGTGSTITYDPTKPDAYNPARPDDPGWEKRPPAVGLAHELIHADHAAHGKVIPGADPETGKPQFDKPYDNKVEAYDDDLRDSKGKQIPVNQEELNTVGDPAYGTDTDEYDEGKKVPLGGGPTTENEIRSQWCEANPDDCKGDTYTHPDGKLEQRKNYVAPNRGKEKDK